MKKPLQKKEPSEMKNHSEMKETQHVTIPTECPICLDPMTSEDTMNGTLAILNCSNSFENPHAFHLDCLGDYLNRKNFECPYCKSIKALPHLHLTINKWQSKAESAESLQQQCQSFIRRQKKALNNTAKKLAKAEAKIKNLQNDNQTLVLQVKEERKKNSNLVKSSNLLKRKGSQSQFNQMEIRKLRQIIHEHDSEQRMSSSDEY